MKRLALAIAAICLTAPAPLLAQQSVQQQFDAGSAALAAGKGEEALQSFSALEQRLAQSKGHSLAVVRARKAGSLLLLQRDDEAEAALRLALPGLPVNDPSLQEDRELGYSQLGEIYERSLDYGAAVRSYRTAEMIAKTPELKLRPIAGAVRTGLFYDAPSALADVDRAIAIAATLDTNNAALTSQLRSLKGRVLLNMKRYPEARAELEAATKGLGGLTLKVDAADLSARSDAAISALFTGDKEAARKFLAYTGAGHLNNAFGTGAEMNPPPCGGEGDLRPEDVAIVEFSVRPDGSVGHVAPIYSSREGDSALAFARAVSAWSWQPDTVAKIPPLFRALTRVEMRCSTAAERPSVAEILGSDLEEWLKTKGVAVDGLPQGSAARRVKPLTHALAATEAQYGKTSIQLLPMLSELGENPIVAPELRAEYLRRALQITRDEHAPATILASIGIRLVTNEAHNRRSFWSGSIPDFAALLTDPTIAADRKAVAAIKVEEAEYRYRAAGQQKQAAALLAQVRDTPGLGEHDPLRAAALVRLASIAKADGDEPAARAAFLASGLGANQCAVLDTKPRLKQMKISNSDFPDEAIRWGFEGWVQAEYDITADGSTVKVRPTVSHPPFVFNDAASKAFARMKFERSFRPDGGLGCGGASERIRFVIP